MSDIGEEEGVFRQCDDTYQKPVEVRHVTRSVVSYPQR